MEIRQVCAFCKVDPDAEVLLQATIQRLGIAHVAEAVLSNPQTPAPSRTGRVPSVKRTKA